MALRVHVIQNKQNFKVLCVLKCYIFIHQQFKYQFSFNLAEIVNWIMLSNKELIPNDINVGDVPYNQSSFPFSMDRVTTVLQLIEAFIGLPLNVMMAAIIAGTVEEAPQSPQHLVAR